MINYVKEISSLLNLAPNSVSKTIELLEQDATIPFIARYRKDQTGGLDEIQIEKIVTLLSEKQTFTKRMDFIIKNIEEQNLLTEELKKKILNSKNITELEDMYLPFKQKRKTRGLKAKENGLEPLAKIIMSQNASNIRSQAQRFVRKGVASTEDALQGARDIIAEWVNERISARNKIRRLFEKEAQIQSKITKKAKDELKDNSTSEKAKEINKFKDYFDFSELSYRSKSHRILALFRGEKDGWLRIKITPDQDRALAILNPMFVKSRNESSEHLLLAIEDSYKRLLKPSLETELRNKLKEKADLVAIDVFADNLRELLLASPVGAKRILAIDPGFRSGCKVVCLNEKGEFLKYQTIFPHPPQNKRSEAICILKNLVTKYDIEVFAIGNGTAGRETEKLIKDNFDSKQYKIFLVNEDGASIYSASKIAREEFPNEDITVRGSISIGRRLMDPLAELVKIDAKSIGVGQYQYDVDQKALKAKLDFTVESCVNSVGINVNTASKYILTYVSGLGDTLAQNIIDYRRANKGINSRNELKNVPRMGAKSYELSIGFLRVDNPNNILDNSAVHPENYNLVKIIAKNLNCSLKELIGNTELLKQINHSDYINSGVGKHTLIDIVSELTKPSIDTRTEAETFEFAANIHAINDIISGMELPGIVTNVTNFGAFVDLGIKENGLVHISNMSESYISDPSEILKVNQHVLVRVLDVDMNRKRIGLKLI